LIAPSSDAKVIARAIEAISKNSERGSRSAIRRTFDRNDPALASTGLRRFANPELTVARLAGE
jgi:hypothetical protein